MEDKDLFRGHAVVEENPEAEEDEGGEGAPPAESPDVFTCRYCPETFERTPAGKARLMRHIRNKHPIESRATKEQAKVQAEKDKVLREKEQALQELPPMAARLREILIRTLKGRSTLADSITQMFHRNLATLSTSRHHFRSWIMRYGLAPDQIAQCEDEIFGLEGFGNMPGSPMGQGNPQTVYVPTQGGGYVPVIINQPPAQSPQQSGIPNLSVTIPGLSQLAQTPRDETLYKELNGIKTEFNKLCDMLAAKEERERDGASRQPQMRRIPVLDEEGKVMRDSDGTILYQEVPYDPMLTAMDMMRQAVSIARASQPQQVQTAPMDEGKIAERVAEKLGVGKGESPETKELRALVDSLNRQMEQRFSQIEHERDMADAVEKAVAPLRAEIQGLQTRSGLSDQQFYLTHRETLQSNFQRFLQAMMQSAREDMRPILVQQAVGSMRAAGVPDELIQTVIKNVGAVSTPASTGSTALDSRIQDARSRWLK